MKRIENKKKLLFPIDGSRLWSTHSRLIGGSGALTGSVGGGDVGVSEIRSRVFF
jgi:hypothetical protein